MNDIDTTDPPDPQLEPARRLAEARQQIAHDGTGYVPPWVGLTSQEQATAIAEARNWLRAAKTIGLAIPMTFFAEALTLIESLADPDDCWFDHHGGCQAHGYLDLKQGEVCPVQHAKDFLAEHQPKEATTP